MKNKGFTLIELLAVIVILGITVTLIAVSVDKNIKDSKNTATEYQINSIEDTAEIYALNYRTELSSYNEIGIELLPLSKLIEKGLIKKSDIEGIDTNNTVLIANVGGNVKAYYDPLQENKNVIFLVGPTKISLTQNATYDEMGAFVAVIDTGVVELTSENITSNVNTSTKGSYTVTYSYENAESITREVKII